MAMSKVAEVRGTSADGTSADVIYFTSGGHVNFHGCHVPAKPINVLYT
jgi:hypothetical protein